MTKLFNNDSKIVFTTIHVSILLLIWLKESEKKTFLRLLVLTKGKSKDGREEPKGSIVDEVLTIILKILQLLILQYPNY